MFHDFSEFERGLLTIAQYHDTPRDGTALKGGLSTPNRCCAGPLYNIFTKVIASSKSPTNIVPRENIFTSDFLSAVLKNLNTELYGNFMAPVKAIVANEVWSECCLYIWQLLEGTEYFLSASARHSDVGTRSLESSPVRPSKKHTLIKENLLPSGSATSAVSPLLPPSSARRLHSLGLGLELHPTSSLAARHLRAKGDVTLSNFIPGSPKYEELVAKIARLNKLIAGTVPIMPRSKQLSFVEKLFAVPDPLFKLAFTPTELQLNSTPAALTPNYFMVGSKLPELDDLLVGDKLVAWLKHETYAFSGPYGPKLHHEDCCKIQKILVALGHNPALYTLEIIKELLARQNVYPLKMVPLLETFSAWDATAVNEACYFQIIPLSRRRIQLTLAIGVTNILYNHETYLGTTFDLANNPCYPLVIKLNFTIDLSDASQCQVTPGICVLESSEPRLETVIRQVRNYALHQSDIIEIVNAKCQHLDYKPVDTLSCVTIVNLPIAKILPTYTKDLLNFALHHVGDVDFQTKFQRTLERDVPATFSIIELKLDPAQEAAAFRNWQSMAQQLKAVGFPDEVIHAIKLSIVQGYLNPWNALWTIFSDNLMSLFDFILGARSIVKPLVLKKIGAEHYVFDCTSQICGFTDNTTCQDERCKFSLFEFKGLINLSVHPDRDWLESAYFTITPFAKKLLVKHKKEHVFNALVDKYDTNQMPAERPYVQEFEIEYKKHKLPDGRNIELDDVLPIFEDNNSGLRAILGGEYLLGRCSRSMLGILSEHLDNTAIQELIFDDLMQLCAELHRNVDEERLNRLPAPIKGYFHAYNDAARKNILDTSNFRALLKQQLIQGPGLASYLRDYVTNEVICPNLSVPILCAFALMNLKRLHCFQEMLPDQTHTAIWRKHLVSYQTPSLARLEDVVLLRSANGHKYGRLNVTISS